MIMASSQQHLGSRSSTLLNILRQFLVIVAIVLPPVTCWAVTPKKVVVMAKSLDDLITLDPAEVFEFSGTEIIANLYDRLFLANPTNPDIYAFVPPFHFPIDREGLASSRYCL